MRDHNWMDTKNCISAMCAQLWWIKKTVWYALCIDDSVFTIGIKERNPKNSGGVFYYMIMQRECETTSGSLKIHNREK